MLDGLRLVMSIWLRLVLSVPENSEDEGEVEQEDCEHYAYWSFAFLVVMEPGH